MNVFDVYPLLDLTPVSAKGSLLYDENQVEYLDLYGGHAVISIGHSHPHYLSRIENQLKKIGFYSNSVHIPLQNELAEKLGKISGYENYQLFLTNSGAESTENALKLASFHTGKEKVLAFKGAFHGRTSGAVAVTDNPKIQAPYNQGHKVSFVSYDREEVEKELKSAEYAAVIIEPIQGVGGIIMPEDSFLKDLQNISAQNGVLLIADEIQAGYGRTGKFFAHQYAGIQPDIITTAKGMGNGFPIGGVLISPKIKASFGLLGTTFGGNHLACAAALAVLEVIEQENLLQNALELGDFVKKALQNVPNIKEVRGRGLMIGIELNQAMAEIKNQLYKEDRILLGAAGTNVLRVLPALNVEKSQLQYFIESLQKHII